MDNIDIFESDIDEEILEYVQRLTEPRNFRHR